jgi:CheY-like chemotaxis protein
MSAVLIVESDEDVREVLGEMTREAGNEVFEAASVDEALGLLPSVPRPCLVLLGDLPGGQELQRRIQELPDASSIHVQTTGHRPC